MRRADSFEKILMLGKTEGGGRATEDEMVGWHHPLNGHEFEETPGDSDGQRSLPGVLQFTESQSWTQLSN